MKNKFLFASVLVLFMFMINSCVNRKTIPKTIAFQYREKSIEELKLSNLMKLMIDSFIVELQMFRVNNVNLVSQIKILESKNNNEFKIIFEGVDSYEELKMLTIDDYFFKNNFCFCIDYNIANLTNPKINFNRKNFMKSTKIENYHSPDSRIPCWLLLIKNNKLVKINKFANSTFSPPETGEIGVFTDTGVIYRKINEWGEVFDDKGNIIDHFPKN